MKPISQKLTSMMIMISGFLFTISYDSINPILISFIVVCVYNIFLDTMDQNKREELFDAKMKFYNLLSEVSKPKQKVESKVLDFNAYKIKRGK